MVRLKPINQFTGPYRFLSNFYPTPILDEGITYPSVEHAFQANKTWSRLDRKKIAAAKSPTDAKRMGRMVELRPDWEQRKLGVMGELLRIKFSDPKLKGLLLSTGRRPLIEGNWWNDRFWGVCLKSNIGENHLGNLLMIIRAELQRSRLPKGEDNHA
jgi:hypothetical protein